MNIKKTSTALMAAAMLAIAAPMTGVLPDTLGVVANAAEMKLITGELDAAIAEKLISNDFINLGKGYYILQDVIYRAEEWEPGEDILAVNKIIRIGDKEIEQWRSTGKLKPTTVQCDVDVSGMKYLSGGFNNGGSYVMFAVMGEEETPGHCYVLKLDETAGKLVKAYDYISKDLTGSWVSGHCTASGESFVYWNGPGKIGVSLEEAYSSTGKKFEINGEGMGWSFCSGAGKYMVYLVNGGYGDNPVGSIYGICKDGSIEEISQFPFALNIDISGDTWVSFSNYDDGKNYILDTTNKQLHELGELKGFIYAVNGSAVTVKWFEYDEAWNATQCYKIIDFNGKDMSKTYTLMETYDGGNTYLVQTSDGKWGYIDSTGKELAMFDDAGSFSGEGLYAPVVKDGKGWLIDRNMNRVSEKIDAVGCTTFGFGQLIRFVTAKDSEGNATADVWVAASDNGGSSTETPSEPSKPTEPAKPAEPTVKVIDYSDKDTGIAAFANEGVIANGAELYAAPITAENTETRFAYDIKFTKDGKEVQPDGSVTIKLPVPEALKGKTVNVYRVESNGKYIKMNSKVEGDLVTFTTDHFSKYLVTSEVIADAENDNPSTGMAGLAVTAGIIAVAGAFVIVSKKKR